jgi:3-oxoacyl-[acyl-carrier-protein] synthase I
MNKQDRVFVLADTIFSPMGMGTRLHFSAVSERRSAVQLHERLFGMDGAFHVAILPEDALDAVPPISLEGQPFTRLERMIQYTLADLAKNPALRFADTGTQLIFATAKGNISHLVQANPYTDNLDLYQMETSIRKISRSFGFTRDPLVISNACISGLLAVVQGWAMLQCGEAEQVVVVAADEISAFILSGFHVLQALSDGPCKPFDAQRQGINLGEGAAAIVLVRCDHPPFPGAIEMEAGAVTNDANHISGPSRTGAELAMAMKRSLRASGRRPEDIDFVSLHGTGTLYNDEMEARAMELAGMEAVPALSLKGNFGHTLGASGLIEAILSAESLRQNQVLPTLGYEESGVSVPVRIVQESIFKPLVSCLKTASGFGGCNAAAVFSKSIDP